MWNSAVAIFWGLGMGWHRDAENRSIVLSFRWVLANESGEDSGEPDVFDWPQFKSMLADAA